jgi:hypothetical protein
MLQQMDITDMLVNIEKSVSQKIKYTSTTLWISVGDFFFAFKKE